SRELSMQPSIDYFSNHRLKLRFPWRLYHAPIVAALERAVALSPGPDVLNLGSGPFFELERLAAGGRRFTVCDIDPRAVELASTLHAARLAGADVVPPDGALPYADCSFDAVVSMDVIEHVPEPLPWLREALRVLKPGGLLFLTTPNYGSRSLRVIENTALEAVARLQRFSRKHLHPTKMDEARLSRVLREAGVQTLNIERIAFDWVLSAFGRKS
ncbi:MAG TPA: class I SAM-dependent methyltransferase, partial [Polyangiaceae bacterium]|nr:class I SAM-dependent methyltransferase [Polyangiaceae bacterium]